MPIPLIGALAEIGLAANGVKALGSSVVNTTKAMTGLPFGLNEFSKSLVAGKDAMRAFSGDVNKAFSKLEVDRLTRTQGMANATAPSTVLLVEKLGEIEDKLAPLQTLSTNLGNALSLVALEATDRIIDILKSIPLIAGYVKEAVAAQKKKGTPLQVTSFLNDIADGKLSGRVVDRIESHSVGGRSGAADQGARNWINGIPGIGPAQ